ncbi:MAG TPA: hypothetical protein VFD11_03760 [Thiopseudomonas sp.]|nr:hypothetical protein [Thiopseudomonas sp.]
MKKTNSAPQPVSPLTTLLSALTLLGSVGYLIYAMLSSELFGFLMPDAVVVYLPLATKLLENPLAILSEPAAVTVAPGSYFYMALAGAEPARIFILNIVLAVCSALLIFDLCRRLGGIYAGLAGALLYCTSPLLLHVLIPTLNEPPYLFFTTLWLWSTVLIGDKQDKLWPVLVAGFALLLSILTRAIYFYWLFPAVVTCLLVYVYSKNLDLKKLGIRILAAHLIAAAGAGAYTFYNWQVHDTPMIATGSGGALYFGSNPVTLGYEPPYFNMIHDEWMVTDRVNSHLTPHNDRRLSFAAKHMLKDMPTQDLAELYINKLGAILFFSQANLKLKVLNQRTFRIVLLLLAGVGVFYYRKNLIVVMLFCAFLYVTAVHVPAMYNQRYSIGALDLPLTLLAALGAAQLLRQRANKKLIGSALLIVLLGITLGSLHQRYSAPLMPRIDKGITHLALQAPLENLDYQGFSNNPLIGSATTLMKTPSITWKNIPKQKRAGTPIISIDVLEIDRDCKKVAFTYSDKEHNTWYSSMQLKRPKAPLTLTFGTLHLESIAKDDSQLDITFKCPADSTLKLGEVALYFSQTGLYYNELLPEELKH